MNAWFDRVYSDPLYLELYETSDTQAAAMEAGGAARLLAATQGARWLEACCGFGRHAEQFAGAGYDVVGVDRSAMMLARARIRAGGSYPNLRYVRADLRQLPFKESFDCATVMFDSFGYFHDDDTNLEALLSLGSALKVHGRLLIQLDNRERIVGDWQPRIVERRPPYEIIKERRLDLAHGRLSWKMQISGGDKSAAWEIDMRLFTASELRDLLERAGFDQIRFLGDWDGSCYGRQSPFLIAAARKAAFADIPPLSS